jgi:hypothetical protein
MTLFHHGFRGQSPRQEEKKMGTPETKPVVPNAPARTPAELAAERKSADDARSGAQAVADAVTKVAQAAVEAAKGAQPRDAGLDFDASGSAGGQFTLDGEGFGASGTVLLSGTQQLFTREWSTTHIAGDLPADAKSGPVAVHVDDKTVKRGFLHI